MWNVLKNKQIVIGVCGGIAAYKAAEFVRRLSKMGAAVRVIMTRSAQAFVGPVTFQSLSAHPVWTEMFAGEGNGLFRHIDWAREADGVVIIPATANIIGKMAQGIADDALTTFLLAAKCPVLVCPSMNYRMFENVFVQRNIGSLREAGFHMVGPCSGPLACGDEGAGRLVDLGIVIERLCFALTPHDLAGEKVLVTAGPTREAVDPVRYLSNPSSGKMGYALAGEAYQRGAEVVLVSGPTHLEKPAGVTRVPVATAKEMYDAVLERLDESTIILKAAAVSDWRPVQVLEHKAKKDQMNGQWAFEKTEDILKTIGARAKNQILVGFAAETDDVENHARRKLQDKNLDLIVANMVGRKDSGFATDTNEATLIYKDGRSEPCPIMEKTSLAHLVLDRVVEIRASKPS